MNATDAELQRRVHDLLQAQGRDLTLELAANGAYSTATGQVTAAAATEVTVRGRLYLKRKGNWDEVVRNGGRGQSDTETSEQKCIIEALGLSRMPRRDDYIVDGITRYRVSKCEPKQGAEIDLTYELNLDKS